MNGRHLFHPDRLPDAALRGVEHPAPLQLLLASALPGGIAQILYPDEKLKGDGRSVRLNRACPRQKRRDIQTEGQIAAGVRADSFPVYVNDAALIHRSKMQEKPPAFFRPCARLRCAGTTDIPAAAAGGLHRERELSGGEGNQNFAVEGLRCVRTRGERIIPQPVQIDPAIPHHGGAGILLPDIFSGDGGGPGSGELFRRTGILRKLSFLFHTHFILF